MYVDLLVCFTILFPNSSFLSASSCGAPPAAPTNGARHGSGATFGASVTYTCNIGYTITVPRSLTCLANRRWSGRAPTCNGKLLCIHVYFQLRIYLMRINCQCQFVMPESFLVRELTKLHSLGLYID